MSEEEVTERPVTSTDGNHAHVEPSWTVSLCFWFTLLIAAGIYAVVALAPKFCVWDQVRLEYRHNTAQLIELENDVAYLECVEAALATDPEFRDRVAGVAQPFDDANEEFIPVSGSLLFGHDEHSEGVTAVPKTPSYHALAVSLASRSSLRTTLLAFAACLTVFAFAFLNDGGTDLVNATGRMIRATAMIPVARYFSKELQRERVVPNETGGASVRRRK